ncbi:hypothetical protein [Streptomyces sp. NPDC004629]|uniref:hypothetical protein n=1 Tax=Streptomyces sp. NPDC004629 TaxID=3364705 RepID=UPI0036951C98
MSGVPGRCPGDRADFAQVLRSALDTAEIRAALSVDATGRAATRLYAWALAADAEIAAAAQDEYRAYAAARATAGHRTSPAEGPPLAGGAGLPPAVLLPLVSAVSAAVLLLIGHGLLLSGTAVRFAGSVRSAGWVLAVAAVAAAALGVATPHRAAPGRDAGQAAARGPVPPESPVSADDVERARRRWQQALLERGVLPYLRRRLPDSLAP